MKTKAESPRCAPVIDNRISIRLDIPIAERFLRVVAASRRSKTSLIEESLEASLPKFEHRHGLAHKLKQAA